mgnify:FL=1
MYQKDPSVLYKMHKNDPEEFARIRSLAPAQQALMVAEYRGRLSAPSPKIVSDAPEPVSEPKSSGSAYQQTYSDRSPREELSMRRRARRK